MLDDEGGGRGWRQILELWGAAGETIRRWAGVVGGLPQTS